MQIKHTCKDCIHLKICNDYVHLVGREDKVACPDYKSTEDVVPRAEVEEIVKFKDMAYAELKSYFVEAKQEVAGEIIAAIEKIIEVDKYGEARFDIRELYELKKKYIGE